MFNYFKLPRQNPAFSLEPAVTIIYFLYKTMTPPLFFIITTKLSTIIIILTKYTAINV